MVVVMVFGGKETLSFDFQEQQQKLLALSRKKLFSPFGCEKVLYQA